MYSGNTNQAFDRFISHFFQQKNRGQHHQHQQLVTGLLRTRYSPLYFKVHHHRSRVEARKRERESGFIYTNSGLSTSISEGQGLTRAKSGPPSHDSGCPPSAISLVMRTSCTHRPSERPRARGVDPNMTLLLDLCPLSETDPVVGVVHRSRQPGPALSALSAGEPVNLEGSSCRADVY